MLTCYKTQRRRQRDLYNRAIYAGNGEAQLLAWDAKGRLNRAETADRHAAALRREMEKVRTPEYRDRKKAAAEDREVHARAMLAEALAMLDKSESFL